MAPERSDRDLLSRYKRLIKGLRRAHPSVRKKRRGLRAHHLRAAFSAASFRGNDDEAITRRAMLAVAWQFLARPSELGRRGPKCAPRPPSRHRIRFT